MTLLLSRPSSARSALVGLGLLMTALLAGATLLAATAQAEPPPAPALTETNPESPGTSATPRVRGDADGVVASSIPFVGLGGGHRASAVDPSNTITIYTDPNCTGAMAGTGTAAELEGPGIEVAPVAPDAITTFYATQTDSVETSECSEGLNYRRVTIAPPSPVFASVIPASPANDNEPHLTGSAAAESVVSIYVTPDCSGPAIAVDSGSSFGAAGIQVSVPDNSLTTFYASASWAGLDSACSSSSIAYQELTPPPPPEEEQPDPSGPPPDTPAARPGEGALPAPRLRTLPAGRANDNFPRVTGSAPGAATVKIYGNADCDGQVLAKGTPSDLSSGFPLQVADNTTSRFYGVAVNDAGASSACSQSPVVYVEDSAPPVTRITLGPSVKTRVRAPVFRFTDQTEDTGTSFLCKLDRRAWRACQTPWRTPPMSRKVHLVRVKAVDAAGNAEARGVQRRFRVVARRHG